MSARPGVSRTRALILLPVFIAGAVMGMAGAVSAASSPVVDSVIPSHGTAAGGTNIQIAGSGLTGVTVVAFGSTALPPCPASGAACFNAFGDNFIGATSPPGAAGTTVDVRVTVGGATSATNPYDKFTFDVAGPPVVSGVSPRSGPASGGTGVQITGSGFTGATAVAFGSTTILPCPASGNCFNQNGDNGIGTNSPPGSAGTVNVRVTVGATTSVISTSDQFTYTTAPPPPPVVDIVDPGHGTAVGGTGVQITGSGFTGATMVAFGSTTIPPCPSGGNCFNVFGDNGIFVSSPSGSVGATVDVTVKVGSVTSVTNSYAKFTYDTPGPPVVTGVTPRSGPAVGNTGVQILGSGFTGATAVLFGSTTLLPCPSSGNCFSVNGDNGIGTNSPPGSAGTTVNVRVTVGATTSAISASDQFNYTSGPPPPPVVDVVDPGHGTAGGGTNVQITGSGFTGATAVAFGSTTIPPCPTAGPCFNLGGDNNIGATSPPGTAGATVDVKVTVGSVTSAINAYAKFTYEVPGPPAVSGVTPRSGPAAGGTGVQILGSGFTGATAVVFGSTTLLPCPQTGNCFNVNGDQGIGTASPPGSVGTVDVRVRVGTTTSAINTSDRFTYSSTIPPSLIVDTVIPNHGTTAGGTGVQILGSGFTGTTAVSFGLNTLPPCPTGGTPCFFQNNDNGIFASSPPGAAATTVDVTVTAGGVTSSANSYDKFTYDTAGPPAVSGVSPRTGPALGGTNVSILGSGFTGATVVRFGSTALPPCPAAGNCFNLNSDTLIGAVSPPGTPGAPLDVTVTVAATTSVISAADKFTYSSAPPPPPVVDVVDPTHGTAAGGTNVQITGSGFSGATAVAFGSTSVPPCPSSGPACFNANGDNNINTGSPPGTSGTTVHVTVTVGTVTSATNPYDRFTYDVAGPPVVSGVSPRSGPAAGGTGVQIFGSGFTGATAIVFGSTTIPPCPAAGNCFFINGDNSIGAASPPGSAGTVNVRVTVGATTSAITTSDQFTYTTAPPPPPVVDVVDPGHGTAAGGTNVQIQGSGFAGVTAVAFGSTALPPCPASGAPCFNSNGDNFIGATTPPGTAGVTVDVKVTVGAVTSATNAYAKFTYDTPGPPTVGGLSPRSGPDAGGSGVSILGSGFTGATAVAFGSTTLVPCPAPGVPCFHVNGDNGIFAKSPPGSAGPVNVTVTVGSMTSATSSADMFTYLGAVAVLPAMANGAYGGYVTAATIQNTGSAPASVSILYFDQSGARVGAGDSIDYMPVNASWTVRQDNGNSFPSSGGDAARAGSAVVYSDRPVAAFVNEFAPGNVGDATSYSGVLVPNGVGTTLYAPTIVNNAYGGYTTGIGLLNEGGSATDVTITYRDGSGTVIKTQSVTALAAHAYQALYSGDTILALPSGFAGTATIVSTAGQPLGAVVNEIGPGGQFSSYDAVPSGSSLLNAPVALNNAFGGYYTGMGIQNTSASSGTVMVTYYDAGGAPTVKSFPIGANGSLGVYQGSVTDGPAVGAYTATIASTVAIAAIVNEVAPSSTSAKQSTSYNAFTFGSTTLHLALVENAGSDPWNTGDGIMNTGTTSTTVTVAYYNTSTGAAVGTPQTLALAPHAFWGLYQPTGGLPSGTRATAVITTSSGGQVAAICNESSATTFMSYDGQ